MYIIVTESYVLLLPDPACYNIIMIVSTFRNMIYLGSQTWFFGENGHGVL